MNNKLFHLFISVCIITICIISFYNSLPNDFAFDDHLAIVNNADTDSSTPLGNLLKNDIWGKNLDAEDSHRSWRPLLTLTFRTIRATFGLSAYHFRVFSIAFHCIASLLVYSLASSFVGSPQLAAGAAFLFAAHPAHVESVAAVVNMAEAMSCITYITSYFLFLWFYGSTKPSYDYVDSISSNKKQSRLYSFPILKGLFWLIFVFAGILLKESALTITAIIIAKLGIDGFVWAAYRCRKDFELSINKGRSGVASVLSFIRYVFLYLIKNLYWVLMPVAAILIYLALRDLVITGSLPTTEIFGIKVPKFGLHNSYLNNSQLLRRAENPFAELIGLEKALSLMYLHFRYFFILLWPVELCAEYAFDCIPKVSTFTDPHFKITIIFYSLFISCIIYGVALLIMEPSSGRSEDKSDNELKGGNNKDGTHPSVTSSTTTTTISEATVETIVEEKAEVKAEITSKTLATSEVSGAKNESIDRNSAISSAKDFSDFIIDQRFLILCMAWYVVTFVPASGVFLKLGTLLAERLLYIPSIAYCILASVLIYIVIREFISLTRIRRSIGVALYWISIVAITSLYALRTIEYNPSWKNDEVLFIDGLKVCSRSAKLQLQVAKIHINRHNFSVAAKHVALAKSIDPEFCDIGYQEALLALFYYNNVDDAMEIAAKNLVCIYSNKHSWELLGKLMDQQMSLNPKDFDMIASHAKLLSTNGMVPLGAKKYQQAASEAFEAKKYAKALIYNKKAYELIPKFQNDLQNPNEAAFNGVADAICSIYALGSYWRYSLARMSPPIKGLPPIDLNLAKEQLLNAISPLCVIVDSSELRVVSNYGLVGVNTLSTLLNGKFDNNNASYLESYALLSEKAATVLMKMDLVGSLSSSGGGSPSFRVKIAPNQINRQAFEFIVVATQFYVSAGKLNFKSDDFLLAADRFKRALSYDYSIPGTIVRDSIPILNDYSYAMFDWWDIVKGFYSNMLPFDVNRHSKYILYWYIHSIAGQSGFIDNRVQIGEVIGSYRAILGQSKQKSTKKGSIVTASNKKNNDDDDEDDDDNSDDNDNSVLKNIYRLAKDEFAGLQSFCDKHDDICGDL